MRERVGERRRSIEKTIGRATTLQERHTDGRGTVSDEKLMKSVMKSMMNSVIIFVAETLVKQLSEGRGKAV